jgi:hypothetical protein
MDVSLIFSRDSNKKKGLSFKPFSLLKSFCKKLLYDHTERTGFICLMSPEHPVLIKAMAYAG